MPDVLTGGMTPVNVGKVLIRSHAEDDPPVVLLEGDTDGWEDPLGVPPSWQYISVPAGIASNPRYGGFSFDDKVPPGEGAVSSTDANVDTGNYFSVYQFYVRDGNGDTQSYGRSVVLFIWDSNHPDDKIWSPPHVWHRRVYWEGNTAGNPVRGDRKEVWTRLEPAGFGCMARLDNGEKVHGWTYSAEVRDGDIGDYAGAYGGPYGNPRNDTASGNGSSAIFVYRNCCGQ